MIRTEHIVAFRIPERGAVTTEASMVEHETAVEWLQTCPMNWEGDEEGIVINVGNDYVVATPGNWVVQLVYGNQWVVVTSDAFAGLMQMMGE